MNKLTNQQVFDKVVTALRLQSAKSLLYPDNGALVCAYRSPDGKKCAAGHILPDELYNPEMENKNIYGIFEFDDLVADRRFLYNLQLIHDNYDVKDWEYNWKDLAQRYKLQYEPKATHAAALLELFRTNRLFH